jgi:ribosomal protein S18 acetylase RimI-like enzyme
MQMPYGWELRPMKTADIDDVLEIVFDHDEDDGDWARESYSQRGVADQYVLTREAEIAGVTGFRPAQETEHAYWLTWTYVAETHQGQKMGTRMLYHLFEVLKKKRGRKIFVSLSDYVDPEKGPIYKKAIKLYKSAGFKEELVHRDYYGPGESEMIYGCALVPTMSVRAPKPDKRGIVLTDIFKIDETDAVYAVDWAYQGRQCFDALEMQSLIDRAAAQNARALFVSFPSNVIQTNTPLQSCGFMPCGMLEDYFKQGLHEVHYRYDFDSYFLITIINREACHEPKPFLRPLCDRFLFADVGELLGPRGRGGGFGQGARGHAKHPGRSQQKRDR